MDLHALLNDPTALNTLAEQIRLGATLVALGSLAAFKAALSADKGS